MKIRNTSGQVLMIGVLLVFILLVAVPAILFMNRSGSLHNVFAWKHSKGNSIAEAGISFGMQQLTQPGNWPLSGGVLPASGKIPSAEGGSFQVSFFSAPYQDLLSYQVGILSEAYDNSDKKIPGSSMFTKVSQKTVAVSLPTGFSAPAAVELMKAPIEGGNATFQVEFGPIVIRDTHPWTMDVYNSQCANRRPRKFSAGGLVPRSPASPLPSLVSDHKEFWAYSSPGFAMVIDIPTYATRAMATAPNCPDLPLKSGAPPGFARSQGNGGAGTGCRYLGVFNDTVTLSGLLTFPANATILISGNAEFDNFTTDLSSGAFIITRNLILGNNNQPANGLPPAKIYVPASFGLEDPYCTCGNPICVGAIDRHVDFKGFLYVKGNMMTDTSRNAQPNNWTVQGVLRVDGQLTLAPNSTLDVYYNDFVNHQILTSNFEVQVDTSTAVP